MAQVAFSHQFSNRWSNAPQAVKDALIQEFEDIVQLLEPETDLDSFQFSVPDLHSYIETINDEVDAEKEKARAEVEKLEIERLELEAKEAERVEIEHQADRQQRIFEAEEAAHLAHMEQQQQVEPDPLTSDNLQQMEVIGTDSKQETDSTNETDTSYETDTTNESKTEQPITEATQTSASYAFESSDANLELDADFVKELESRIDDYLSEQLANMSEDLKSWLREQVANRLNNKL